MKQFQHNSRALTSVESLKLHENGWFAYRMAWLAQGCSLLPFSFFHFPATAPLGKRHSGKVKRGAQIEGNGLERKRQS